MNAATTSPAGALLKTSPLIVKTPRFPSAKSPVETSFSLSAKLRGLGAAREVPDVLEEVAAVLEEAVGLRVRRRDLLIGFGLGHAGVRRPQEVDGLGEVLELRPREAVRERRRLGRLALEFAELVVDSPA